MYGYRGTVSALRALVEYIGIEHGVMESFLANKEPTLQATYVNALQGKNVVSQRYAEYENILLSSFLTARYFAFFSSSISF